MIEITNNAVLPDKIAVGENVLLIVGGVGVTTSVSVAVHAPEPVQDAFVLLTFTGGVIDAVFVTAACASAGVASNPVKQKKASTIPQARMDLAIARQNSDSRKTRP